MRVRPLTQLFRECLWCWTLHLVYICRQLSVNLSSCEEATMGNTCKWQIFKGRDWQGYQIPGGSSVWEILYCFLVLPQNPEFLICDKLRIAFYVDKESQDVQFPENWPFGIKPQKFEFFPLLDKICNWSYENDESQDAQFPENSHLGIKLQKFEFFHLLDKRGNCPYENVEAQDAQFPENSHVDVKTPPCCFVVRESCRVTHYLGSPWRL